MSKYISLRFYQFVAILIFFLLLGYYAGTNEIKVEWKKYKPIINLESKSPPPPQTLNMDLFYSILDKTNDKYYDRSKIDTKKILYGAIAGMLQSLEDPYTSFFPPKENASFKTQMAGEFFGIGAELGMSKEKRIMVISPLDDSPAKKAGIRNGDLILKVNDEETTGWNVSEAVNKIRGEKGTTVTLTILHEGAKTPVNIKIVRGVITVKSVTGELRKVECKDNKCEVKQDCPDCATVGYIRISQFGDKTNDEWIAKANELDNQIRREKSFKGLILDLRNNPGGYLQDAVFIASEFIKSGVVVIQEDNMGERNALSVSRKGLFLDQPVIVLVNKGSASASEIVAGAMKDYNRAKLLGENTFGKGTIQEAIEVEGSASVHLSVAKWLTPNGNWVHEEGIKPDIPVELIIPEDEEVKVLIDNQLERAMIELVR